MKKVVFPQTNRVHGARQKLLLKELGQHFDVEIFEPKRRSGNMVTDAILCSVEFNNFLAEKKPDALLARGDRYEILPMVVVAAYRNIPIVHLEGGDLSGAIDNRVRHAITQLSTFHFCTNDEAHERLIRSGVPMDRVWNYGSLDVEYALSVPPKRIREGRYILTAYHPIDGENEEELLGAAGDHPTVSVTSNKDSGRTYGEENFTPEDYINIMRGATCLVGNSSSLIKEASVLGVPVVLVGERQHHRLLPRNVLKVPCEKNAIREAVAFQSKRTFEPDLIYSKPDTAKNISDKIKEIL